MKGAVLVIMLAAAVAVAPAGAFPRVVVYGASWCGPCGVVKAFLAQHAVPFEWRDIDDDTNRDRFERESDGIGGIPLTVVGGEKVRGSNLGRLASALGLGATPARPSAGEELYGDHPASWWQAQFAALKGRLERHKARVAAFRRTAQYQDELAALRRLEAAQRPLEQALSQLESDASEVALPRRYR